MRVVQDSGIEVVEDQAGAVGKVEKVLRVDAVVTPVGTAEAANDLIRKTGGEVMAACFIINLPGLGGADRMRRKGVSVHTLMAFEGD